MRTAKNFTVYTITTEENFGPSIFYLIGMTSKFTADCQWPSELHWNTGSGRPDSPGVFSGIAAGGDGGGVGVRIAAAAGAAISNSAGGCGNVRLMTHCILYMRTCKLTSEKYTRASGSEDCSFTRCGAARTDLRRRGTIWSPDWKLLGGGESGAAGGAAADVGSDSSESGDGDGVCSVGECGCSFIYTIAATKASNQQRREEVTSFY